MGEYYVFRNPANGHAAVARMGEGGLTGWMSIHGPTSFQACWDWIRANCRGGPNLFIC